VAKRANLVADIALGAWSIVKGLTVTFQNALRPRVTRNYPKRRAEVSPRWRGRLVHLRGDDGRLRCTACLACQKACPTNALPSIIGDDQKGREKRAQVYVWDASRCLFCGLCVEACPFDAIRLSQEYSLVGEARADVIFDLAGLLEPERGGPA
jgi:NADH-quinone oxidoreductase subunit I